MVTQNAWNSEDPAQVLRGGTGLTTLTDHNLLIGNDQQPIVLLPPDPTEGIPVVSNGTTSDPSYGTAFVVGGGTGATSFTPFSTITAGGTATSPLNPVSPGNTGDVLTSNGPGAFPSYQPGGGPPGTGAFVWLSSLTANNDPQLTFDNTFINAVFDDYFVSITGIIPIDNGAQLILDISTDNGATWVTGGFVAKATAIGDTVGHDDDTDNFILSRNGNRAINSNFLGYYGKSFLFNFTSGVVPSINGEFFYISQVGNVSLVGGCGGYGPGNLTINAIRFILDSGNISSGRVDLYGVKTS